MLSNPSLRILAGLVAGLALGALLAGSELGNQIARVAASTGQLWLDALTMPVVPMVFSLLAAGMMAAVGESSGSGLAGRSLMWFGVLLLGACFIAIWVTLFTLNVLPLPAAAAGLASTSVGAAVPAQPSNWLSNIFPTNPIRAAAETAMVPIVIFAMLFGLAASRIESELRTAIDRLVRGVAETMLVIVRWVLKAGPIGVFALAFGVGERLGSGAAGVLAHYVTVVIVVCLSATVLAYLCAALFGGMSVITFARAALPPQVIAVSTQSSLASLPAMIETSPALGVTRATAGVVLPMAVSLFRMASAAANVAVAIYLAQIHQVALTPGTLVMGAAVAAAVSVAAVGLPAQISFFAIIAPVCLAMGVPVTLLPLLLAIETLPDVFRTLGNVTADIAVTRIVGRSEIVGRDHSVHEQGTRAIEVPSVSSTGEPIR